jgi:MYXO-CTERM domain-containing protein
MESLRLPGDPHGIEEPYDVLAADEFAMPAHADVGAHTAKSGGASMSLVILGAAALAGLVVYAALRRR